MCTIAGSCASLLIAKTIHRKAVLHFSIAQAKPMNAVRNMQETLPAAEFCDKNGPVLCVYSVVALVLVLCALR
jgi:hypothetical protein